MGYRLRFGTLDLPTTLMPSRIDSPGDIADEERPRADGATQQILRRKARMLTVDGAITGASADIIQATLDTLKQALIGGAIQPLWFGRDDRFINAQCESFTDDFAGGTLYGVLVNISIGFKAADPYFYAVSATNTTLSASGGIVTNSGQAPTSPSWTITIGTGGTGPITLTNTTSGEVAVIAGPFSIGDVIVLNRATYAVTFNGASSFSQLTGRIPTLLTGANSITLGSAGTAVVGSLSVGYTARWH